MIILNGTMQKALGATFSSGSHSLMWVALAHHNSTLMLWRCVCRVVGKVLGENGQVEGAAVVVTCFG